MRSFVIRERVKVDDEEYLIVMQLTAIEKIPKGKMTIVRSECKRLLPSWIKSKIEAGAR